MTMVRPGIIVLPRTVPLSAREGTSGMAAIDRAVRSTAKLVLDWGLWAGGLRAGLDFGVVQWSGLAHHSGMRSANMVHLEHDVNDNNDIISMR